MPVADATAAATPAPTSPTVRRVPVGPPVVIVPITPAPFAGELPVQLPQETVAGGALFTDGIPTTFHGHPVARVGLVANLSVGTSVLVAGWYLPLDCANVLDGFWCSPGALFDLPAGSSRTDAVALDRGLGDVAGPRILRATVSPNANCILDGGSYCPSTLTVKRVVWSGSRATAMAPIDAVPLLTQLSQSFPYVDFMPLAQTASCPGLPVESYAAVPVIGLGPESGLPLPVSVVLLFPSSQARRDAQAMVVAGCPEITAGLVDVAVWVLQRNVMLLSTDPASLPQVQAAVQAAYQQAR